MSDWQNYKKLVRETDPEIGKDVDEVEEVSAIVGTMIERRHDLRMSQRDLAALCGIPHSSVARIESGRITPNLSTLLKIFHHLGLGLSVRPLSRRIPIDTAASPYYNSGKSTKTHL